MPIYEYRCEACGHELEKLQKLADAPLTDCPACGQPTLKKQISAAGFRLKGSGWYETDFKQGDKKKNLHTDGEKTGGGGGGGAAKADKKADAPKAAESTAKPAESKPAAKSDAS
ncbi:zinc ribbon domain-containing protein [uncultured Thiodictyon sp.]|uniref:FmdB family zinc ribbon protein n=1 Tax=uncultured Thiodictyon sp. TaxID=1846217 RepID=UPI0025D11B02|nr:zinc ribbon domain-containing protein [uncultured Thiodictyon sp.]